MIDLVVGAVSLSIQFHAPPPGSAVVQTPHTLRQVSVRASDRRKYKAQNRQIFSYSASIFLKVSDDEDGAVPRSFARYRRQLCTACVQSRCRVDRRPADGRRRLMYGRRGHRYWQFYPSLKSVTADVL